MPAYRFCRPDDIPLLVRAVNLCCGEPESAGSVTSVDRFRQEMRELDVWPSNSMVALDADEPVAVLVGTKRPTEVLVRRLGVRSGHRRCGHGRHLLTSLSQKLAVLGPPRLIAEVPQAAAAARSLLAACGYAEEARYADWRLAASDLPPTPPAGLVAATTIAELATAGLLPADDDRAWRRRTRTLLQAGEHLHGLAVATPDRVEAWLVFRVAAGDQRGGVVEIEAAGFAPGARRSPLFAALCGAVAATAPGRDLVLTRLAPGELPEDLLRARGFVRGAETLRFAAGARPA